MKILFLLPATPYPVTDGAKIRTHNFIQSLSQDNELSLLCLDDNIDDFSTNEIQNDFKDIWTVKRANQHIHHNKRYFNGLLHRIIILLKCYSWEIQNHNHALESKLLDILERNTYDVIFCRYIGLAKYLIENIKKIKCKIIIDLDDIEPIKHKRSIKQNIKKRSYNYYRSILNNLIFSKYHRKLQLIDNCIVCSDIDAAYIKKKRWSKKISVVPNAINVNNYIDIKPFSRNILNQKTFICCANLGYKPNVDGLNWFIKLVWPRIIEAEPDSRLFMVGKNPDKNLIDFADNESIYLFADVESVLPYYDHSSISIVPLHVAGGTRIKILEAFAAQRPVISTSIGAEGLDIENGKECLIADDPEVFAVECLRLLNNYESAKKLTHYGYSLVTEKYDTHKIKESISKLFLD